MSVKFGLDFLDTKTRSEEGRWLEIIHPASGKPTGIALMLFGPDSTEFIEAEARIKQRETLRLQQNSDESANDVFQREDEIKRELLVAITHKWKNVFDDQGREVNCTPEHRAAFYETYPVVQRQVAAFVNDISNWLLETEKNSQSGQSGDSGSAGEVPTAETLSHL